MRHFLFFFLRNTQVPNGVEKVWRSRRRDISDSGLVRASQHSASHALPLRLESIGMLHTWYTSEMIFHDMGWDGVNSRKITHRPSFVLSFQTHTNDDDDVMYRRRNIPNTRVHAWVPKWPKRTNASLPRNSYAPTRDTLDFKPDLTKELHRPASEPSEIPGTCEK